MAALQRLKTWCLDLLFPKYCVGCGLEGAFLCMPCRGRLAFGTPACPVCRRRNFTGIVCPTCGEVTHLRRFLAPFSYRDPLVRELIHTYKYAGVRELAATFADEIEAFLNFYGVHPHGPSALVPIPLHRSRERSRGFNQARLLAEVFGQRLGLPVIEALARVRPTEQQIEMKSHDERRANVAGAFRVATREELTGRTAILVDDVSTSGATLAEAARTLRDAGCHTVWAITIAKG